jgi:hypothetical protein
LFNHLLRTWTKNDYNDFLRAQGYDVPMDAPPYSEFEYRLIVGCKNFREWMEINFGTKHINDEVLEAMRLPFYRREPLIVYSCGFYNAKVREEYREEAQAQLETNPEWKKALKNLNWNLIGLNLEGE